MIKRIWKSIAVRAWMIIAIILALLLGAVTIVTTAVYDIYELLNGVMPGGGPRAVYADGVEPIYTTEYESKKEVYEAAREMNREICEEGMVLLKNKEGALPLNTPVSDGTMSARPKISVFGKNSVNLAYGGSGSGGANTANAVDLYTALNAAGYDYNPTLKAFYDSTSKSGPVRKGNTKNLDDGDTVILSTAETPQSMYTQDVISSYQSYREAALVVITRIGGEGFDLPRTMKGATGYRNEDDHFLQLDANEEALIAAVCNVGFERVIVIVNSGQALELGFLEEDSPYITEKGYLIDPTKIDAAIWMGFPGETGTYALGNILNGSVNPSGKLADTYATDFKQDPTWYNLGDNRITAVGKEPGGDQYVFDVSNSDQPEVPYYFVDYEEGIYVGYKYYETRGAADEEWYQSHVVYPFGFGLSYTSFDWELTDASEVESAAIEKNGKYTVKVKVTNSGTVAGREVVQLYGHAPYNKGGIEKAEETLLDFAKTKLLAPGESETLGLTFDPYYLASYDYTDANHNGNKGYELERGDYALYINRDAHTTEYTVPFTVDSDILYDKDTVTGQNDVVNRYTDCEDPRFNADTSLETVLSRGDWENTFPVSPTEEERHGDATLLSWLGDTSHNNPTDFGSATMPLSEENNGLKLRDLLFDENGEYLDADGDGIPLADYDDERWERLIDQCAVSDMIRVFNRADFRILDVMKIGLPRVSCADGPVGWANFTELDGLPVMYNVCSYCSQTLVATSWSKEIAERFGAMVGSEGIIGNERGDKTPYSGWYAPGVNIHRSPFGGRNFEYYSEDATLSGIMAAAQIRGCNSKGVFTFVKHFAVNEQETHRSLSGISSWLTEQALREIYLRPFEIAVKEGNSRGMMSSFTRIGTRWTGGDYRLLTEILRNEWGFHGAVISDFNTIPAYMNSRQMAYAGGDLNLTMQPVSWCDSSSAADVTILRQNFKHTLYAVVNSNAMNGVVVGYKLPLWTVWVIVVDCVVVAGLGLWGFFVIRRAKKKFKS